MAPVNILKFPISSPADTSPLEELKKAGYNPSQILGVIGKTEGNGCVNDFSRTLAAAVWEPLIPKSAVTIFSGGTEGVLTPHVTFVVSESGHTGLLASVGRTRVFEPHEIGTAEQARQVAGTVSAMIHEMNVKQDNVTLALIKCPLLTSAKIEVIRKAGEEPITTDTYNSMAKSRYASAVGVLTVVAQLDEEELENNMMEGSCSINIASCSSGAELDDCHILLIANAPTDGNLRSLRGSMEDAIDFDAIMDLVRRVGQDRGHIVQVFAKAEADPTGLIRGRRHTMNTDSDIQSTRHARAAVGGLIAGVIGDTMVYVSGGAEGQGPPGGGGLCVIYRRDDPMALT